MRAFYTLYSPLYLLVFTLLIVTSSGCKKGDTGPAGPAGPLMTGTLVGYVQLYDEFGKEIPNREGVQVALGDRTAVTDTKGRFELRDVNTGTYNVVFTRAGFGTYQSQGYQFLGGGVPTLMPTVIMSQLSTTLVSGLALTVTGTGIDMQVYMEGTMQPPPDADYRRGVRVFISDRTPVTPSSAKFVAYLESSTESFKRPVFYTTPQEAGFASGATLYAVAHGDATMDFGWLDVASGVYQYSSLNPTASNIASVTLP